MPASRDDIHRVVEAKQRLEPRKPKRRKRMPKSTNDPGLAKYRKAIAGLLTPIVTYAGVKVGLGLPPDVAAAAAGLLAGVVVAYVPNSYGTGLGKS